MQFLFGRPKPKSPVELVKSIKEALVILDGRKDPKSVEKATEELSRNLSMMKAYLYGDNENPPSPEVVTLLATEVYSFDLLPDIVENIGKLEFEARKDVAQIFNNLLRRQVGSRTPTVEYVMNHPALLDILVSGYENHDIALNCGSMLRECLRHESLTKHLIWSENFYKFFKYVEFSSFDVASDAFATFKDILVKHKGVASDFLDKNFDRVFEAYTGLLNSTNYVTKRQSLKLLGELLLDRANFNIMTRYISSAENLKLMMNLLRDKSKSIQFEAFHVFKVFVANPNKSAPIRDILFKNKEKLIHFLTNFQNEKDDEQFAEEKSLLLKEISALSLPS
mmetsp:Transcript_6935/g.10920  ORF Transcript_6935/g.10920 Transcript_6935/m.10920 type:complete len:337 (+) Transcript_6935:126-1136(+)